MFKVRYLSEPPDDRFLVMVAYGTSNTKPGRRPHDFTVSNKAKMDLLRLPQGTRFDLDNVMWLPWARPYFCPRRMDDRFSTPTISVLPIDLQRLLGWTMQERDRLGLNGAFRSIAQATGTDD